MALTARQVYEGTLIELNKIQAPSMLLEDFNYFINKAINQYINKKYSTSYDINQQATDDLRVLKATTVLNVSRTSKYNVNGLAKGDVIGQASLQGATYEAMLPMDYLHLLNCVCNFEVHKNYKCYNAGTYVQFGATRLTSDLYGQIINNFYMKPSYKRPYYYLHNVNTQTSVPTNPWNGLTTNATDGFDMPSAHYNVQPGNPSDTLVINQNMEGGANAPRTFTFNGAVIKDTYYLNGTVCNPLPTSAAIFDQDQSGKYYLNGEDRLKLYYNSIHTEEVKDQTSTTLSLVEKEAAHRYGNISGVRIEIRTGKDTSIFELKLIYVDYIKAPLYIRLTLEQIDLTEDTSQMMEFPDYVCQEIINELTHLIMENTSDPRLLSHMPISMSIASPAPQLQQQSK